MERGRPIFVVGCPRSGTTLLQLMLHAHPRIALPPETSFVLPVYYGRRSFGDLRLAENREAVAAWITRRRETRFRDLALDTDAVTARIVEGPPTIGSALAAVLTSFSDRFHAVRWGDKRPGYIQHLPALLRLFPDAQIVHLIRDPRDTTGSLKEMGWWRQDTYAAIATWAQAIDSGQVWRRRLGPVQYQELRYEDLLNDPKPVLRELCGFLGEDFDAAMLAPYDVADEAVPKRKKWHRRTRGALTTSRIGAWRKRLDGWEIALCDRVLAGRMAALGYEPSGLSGPEAGHLARYHQTFALRRAAVSKRRAIDRVRRLTEPNPVAHEH